MPQQPSPKEGKPSDAAALSELLAVTGVTFGTLSFLLHISVDVFCVYRTFPLALAMGLGLFFAVIATPMVHVSGYLSLPGYQVWQPFQGGTGYTVMQFFTWTFYASCVILSTSLFVSSNEITVIGGMSAIGGLGFAATVLQVVSLKQFQPFVKTIRDPRLPNRDSFAIILVSLCALIATGVADFSLVLQAESHQPAFILCALCHTLVAFFCHSVIGPRRYNYFYVWQPFQGGFVFIMLQIIGWCVLSTCAYVMLSLTPAAYRGLQTLLSMGCFCSVIMLTYSLEVFDNTVTIVSPKGGHNTVSLRWTKERFVYFLMALNGYAVLILIDVAKVMGFPGGMTVDIPWVCFVAACVLWTMPVCTHVLGGRRVSRMYESWQPFRGGPQFTALQAVGWTMYALSLMVMILYLFNGVKWFGTWAIGTFGFFSEILIIASLAVYDETQSHPSTAEHSTKGLALYGETLVSLFVTLGGVVLFVIVDYVGPVYSSEFPSIQGLFFGILAVLAGPPLAHMSGRRACANFKLWQPFVGGEEYVSIQAMGWTLYGVLLGVYMLLSLNFRQAYTIMHRGNLTLCGLAGLIPTGLILLSLRFYGQKSGGFRTRSSSLVVEPNLSQRNTKVIAEVDKLLELVSTPEVKLVLTNLKDTLTKNPFAEVLNPEQQAAGHDAHPGITFVASAMAVGSLAFFSLGDVMALMLPEDWKWAGCVATFSVAWLSGMTGCVTLHVFGGPSKYAHYQLWQPFKGGFNFLLLQTIGWGLLSIQLVLSLATLYTGFRAPYYVAGIMVLLGILTFVGHTVLFVSLTYFDDSPEPQQFMADSFLQRNAEFAVATLITIGAFLMFIAVDSLRRNYGELFGVAPIVVLASLALCAALPLMYISIRKSSKRNTQIESVTDLNRLELAGMITFLLEACVLVFAMNFAISKLSEWQHLVWYLVFVGVTAHAIALMRILIAESDEHTTVIAFTAHFARIIMAEVLTVVLYTAHLFILYLWFDINLRVRGCTKGSILTLLYLFTIGFIGNLGVVVLRALCSLVAVVGLVQYDWDLFLSMAVCTWYTTTYNDSHRTYRRSIKIINSCQWIWNSISDYFSFELVAAKGVELKPGRSYMMCFHPHGIYPLTCVWATRTTSWVKRFPGIAPSVHSASVVFGIPVLRDVLLWLGTCDVSRAALVNGIQDKRSFILVPGGQAEMRESRSEDNDLILITRHKGFVRLALQYGVPLVPMFSFGEVDLMDNVRWPSVQQWFVTKIGFNYPHFPYGRWWLPLPRRHKVTLVIGHPIEVPLVEDPTPAIIDKYHEQYYRSLAELFEANKAKCGAAHRKILLRD
eukprot:PhF_6_TR44215/c0_g1_i1/m.67912